MSLVFDLNIKNYAVTSKDRTGLFLEQPEKKISVETGRRILDWCNEGSPVSATDISGRIEDCVSIQDLIKLYHQYPDFQQTLKPEFENRKRVIIMKNERPELPAPILKRQY